MITFLYFSANAQIKTLFKDKKNDNRTIVIKENDADDYKILDDQFGDAKVGEVIRITTNKVPIQKSPKEKLPPVKKVAPQKPKTPQKIVKKSAPPVKKEIKKAPPKVSVKKKIRKGPDGPSGIPGTYPVKERPKGKKVFVSKRKKFKKAKMNSCFDKW